MNVYPLGSRLRLSVAFADQNGNAVDPTTVTFRLKYPDASVDVEVANVVRDNVGAYHFDATLTESGRYYYRFEGAGAVVAVREAEFRVRPSKIVT